MSVKTFTQIIVDYLFTELKPQGYRRKGSNFTKEVEDVQLIINLQSSSKTQGNLLVTTINLGVYSKPLALLLEDNAEAKSIWDCHWQQRLGILLPENFDKWWEVRTLEEAYQVGNELVVLLRLYGLPALEAVSSTAKLISLWHSGQGSGIPKVNMEKYIKLLATTISTI